MPSLAGVQKAHTPGDKSPLTASLQLESGTPYVPPTDLELAAYSAGVGSLHGSTFLASVHRTVSLAVSAQQHLSDSRVHSSRDLHAPISRCPQRSRKILCLAWAGKARSLGWALKAVCVISGMVAAAQHMYLGMPAQQMHPGQAAQQMYSARAGRPPHVPNRVLQRPVSTEATLLHQLAQVSASRPAFCNIVFIVNNPTAF